MTQPLWATLFATTLVAVRAPAQPESRTVADRTNALHLLQGSASDGTLDAARIALLTSWLGRIRKAHPAVAKIHVNARHALGEALVVFDDKTAARLRRGEWTLESGRRMQKGDTGIAELDALQKAIGARLHRGGLADADRIFRARFAKEMDVPAVSRRYAKLTCVEDAMPNGFSGDGNDVLLAARGGKLCFVFKRGWGDCLAGCIHNHYYYFEVDTAKGTITPRGELDAEKGVPARIHRWAVPARFAVGPFADCDGVLCATLHRDWWVALHGIEVIGRMLAGAKTPWVGEDDEHRERFERVRDGIAARKGAAYRALLLGLASSDSAVRAAALRWLRRLSKLDHGADAAGIRAWQAWLARKGFRG